MNKTNSTEEETSLSLPFLLSYSQHGGQILQSQSHGLCLKEPSPGPWSGPAAAALGAVCPSSALLSASLQESVDLGEIMFSLCYLPTAGRLTLTVIKCRNLKAMDITGYSGTSVTRGPNTWLPSNPDVRIWKDVQREGGRIVSILRRRAPALEVNFLDLNSSSVTSCCVMLWFHKNEKIMYTGGFKDTALESRKLCQICKNHNCARHVRSILKILTIPISFFLFEREENKK